MAVEASEYPCMMDFKGEPATASVGKFKLKWEMVVDEEEQTKDSVRRNGKHE